MRGHRHRGGGRCGEVLSLDDVPPGSSAVICALAGDEAYCERLRAMGLREGERVEVVKQAPLADPREYRVGNVHLSLGRADARVITVGQACTASEPGRHGWGWRRRRQGDHAERPGPGWLPRRRGRGRGSSGEGLARDEG